MAAHIEQRVDMLIVRPDDDNRFIRDFAGEIIARHGNAADVTGAKPVAHEYSLDVDFE
jgi:hypothetical protein